MMSSLKFILSTQLKRSGINKTISGFTLIELLVAMVMAILVITPLLAFMINILDSDRKEQAKATSEQEIQAAMDYISRDLEQAVYIYDADGLTQNHTSTVDTTTNTIRSGIKDQIPPLKSAPNCSPTSASNLSVCTPILIFWKRKFIADSIGINSSSQTSATETDDGFAYSLVAYYLITNPNSANSTWSQEARIGRFELRGPVNGANANTTGNATDTGFNLPPLNKSGTTLKEKMNQWETALGASANYTQRVETLVDYISTSDLGVTCSSGQRIGTAGFYACVDASTVLAQVYIRGNALARIQNNNLAYNANTKSYFPSASIQVQGRGFLFTK